MLCLWRRPEATATIRPLTWEPPYAVGAAQRNSKKTKKKKKKKKRAEFALLPDTSKIIKTDKYIKQQFGGCGTSGTKGSDP